MKNSTKINDNNFRSNGKAYKERINNLDSRFGEYGGKALGWRRKCELLLPEIVKYEVWKAKRFSSVYEYAAKKAGMSRRCVDEALRVLKRIEDKPELQKVAVEKGLQRVRPVAVIATEQTEGFWASKAMAMGKHTLETYVKNYREEILPGEGVEPDGRVDEWRISGEMGGENVGDERVGMKEKKEVKVTVKLRVDLVDRLKKQGDLNEMMEKFLDFVECGGDEGGRMDDEGMSDEGRPESVKAKSRYVPVKIKKYVKSKNGGKCAFPGCCKKGEILHHTQRFVLEKVHDPDRMAFLCKEHERLAHLGLIEGEEGPLEEWRIRRGDELGGMDGLDVGCVEEACKKWIDQQVWLYR